MLTQHVCDYSCGLNQLIGACVDGQGGHTDTAMQCCVHASMMIRIRSLVRYRRYCFLGYPIPTTELNGVPQVMRYGIYGMGCNWWSDLLQMVNGIMPPHLFVRPSERPSVLALVRSAMCDFLCDSSGRNHLPRLSCIGYHVLCQYDFIHV